MDGSDVLKAGFLFLKCERGVQDGTAVKLDVRTSISVNKSDFKTMTVSCFVW